MEFSCIHCGKQFGISPEQFGTSGRCPHCGQTVHLPEASDAPDQDQEQDEAAAAPGGFLSNSISGLVSLVVHMVVLLLAAQMTCNNYGSVGDGDDVIIGMLPKQPLSDANEDDLASEDVARDEAADELDDLSPPAPDDASNEVSLDDVLFTPAAPGGGAAAGSFDLGAVSIGGDMAGGDWDGMIRGLQRNGLDIVFAFDSTGSMGGEIREVKSQIKQMGATLLKLVPKARIGLCTYRDEGDSYVVKGMPLTNDLQKLDTYLSAIGASGGGDMPEAVHEGLRWSVDSNQFRPRARKVILLFGDAPPHREHLQRCLQIASDFNREQQGVVSTVTCHSARRLPEFVEIADVGGGEAFLTSDRRQIMTQLMVLVFGSRYRSKVVEAFELMGEGE